VALVAVGASTWFRGRGDIAEASIAVLPFENLSGETENEYFSDGITDDILTALSKVGGLKVISRTSTLQYKGTTKPIKEIADELDVATILEGTVRRSGDQVRITAQLIDARTDEHVWAETYDRELTDVFAIQSEIASRIADRLHVALSQRETASIRAGETSSPEAYDLVLRARNRLLDNDQDQIPRTHSAIALLRQALELDPGYAQAHATLGFAYANLVFADNRSWADSALAASRRAIELAPELSSGHGALGYAQYALGKYGEALASLRRAIELDPNNVGPRSGAALVLDDLGRWDEELEILLPAVRADPGDAGRYRRVADLYERLGLPDLAETWLAEAERRGVTPAEIHASRAEWAYRSEDLDRAEAEMREVGDPRRYGASNTAAGIALARGRYDEARRVVETVNRESSFEYAWIITPGYIEWKTGNREEAEALFREGERRSREVMAEAPERSESYLDMARITSTRGDIDAAESWMEKAYEHGYRNYRFIRASPILENVRADPRFERLMRRMEADVAAMRERAPKEMP
jgi:TolB-like protein/Tfp pilus assembly protein PilF